MLLEPVCGCVASGCMGLDPNPWYSLPIAQKVKKVAKAGRQGQTRVSAKHQVTIPLVAFRGAGLREGDTLRVEADGAGRVVLTRVEELLARYSGCLDSGGELRARVQGLRDEWP